MLDTNLMLKTSGAQTSSTNGGTVDFGQGMAAQPLTFVAVVTAVSGSTPTLDLKVQESDNGSTWRDFLALPQITAVGVYRVTGKSNARYMRYASTIAGTTPSFTYQFAPELGGQYESF